jgi:hypothetical protein
MWYDESEKILHFKSDAERLNFSVEIENGLVERLFSSNFVKGYKAQHRGKARSGNKRLDKKIEIWYKNFKRTKDPNFHCITK